MLKLKSIEVVLVTFVGAVFVTLVDTLSAAFIVSSHRVTEVSAILSKSCHSHKYTC